MLEHVILGLLMEGPMSGYDLKKTIDHSVGTFYKASFGSLYPALKRLTEKGLVSVTETEDAKNKKNYSLLPGGRDEFMSWLAEPLQVSRNELLIRIFFYDYLDEDTRQQRLSEYQFKLEHEISRLKAVEQIVSGELQSIDNPQDYYYRVSVLSYGLKYFNMEKQWIRDIKGKKELKHDEPNE